MELNITQKKENKVLQRNEITGEISFTGPTPSNAQLQEELAKKLGTQKETIAIKHIYGKFGQGTATVHALAYNSKEQHDKIEPKKKEKKAAPGAAPAK